MGRSSRWRVLLVAWYVEGTRGRIERVCQTIVEAAQACCRLMLKALIWHEAEFVTTKGATVAVLTLNSADIHPRASREILHVRDFAPAGRCRQQGGDPRPPQSSCLLRAACNSAYNDHCQDLSGRGNYCPSCKD